MSTVGHYAINSDAHLVLILESEATRDWIVDHTEMEAATYAEAVTINSPRQWEEVMGVTVADGMLIAHCSSGSEIDMECFSIFPPPAFAGE